MADSCTESVARAGEDPPRDLLSAVAEELVALWSDLAQAVLTAGDGWTLECEGLVVRIVMLSRLTAVTPAAWVPHLLIKRGIYHRIVTAAGLAPRPAGDPDGLLLRQAPASPFEVLPLGLTAAL